MRAERANLSGQLGKSCTVVLLDIEFSEGVDGEFLAPEKIE